MGSLSHGIGRGTRHEDARGLIYVSAFAPVPTPNVRRTANLTLRACIHAVLDFAHLGWAPVRMRQTDAHFSRMCVTFPHFVGVETLGHAVA